MGLGQSRMYLWVCANPGCFTKYVYLWVWANLGCLTRMCICGSAPIYDVLLKGCDSREIWNNLKTRIIYNYYYIIFAEFNNCNELGTSLTFSGDCRCDEFFFCGLSWRNSFSWEGVLSPFIA